MQKISSCLWFNTQAKEAAEYYISVFKDGKINKILYYGKEGFEIHGKPEGSVMLVEFEIQGMQFQALNGGPEFVMKAMLQMKKLDIESLKNAYQS